MYSPQNLRPQVLNLALSAFASTPTAAARRRLHGHYLRDALNARQQLVVNLHHFPKRKHNRVAQEHVPGVLVQR